MARIAMVDNEALVKLSMRALSETGHELVGFPSPMGFDPTQRYDLIIAGEALPGKKGSVFLGELREAGSENPLCLHSSVFGCTEEEAFLRKMAIDLVHKDSTDWRRIYDYVGRKLGDPDKLLFYMPDGGVKEVKKCVYRKSVEGDLREGVEPSIRKCTPCRGFDTACNTYIAR